ncbi:hypothetical protein PLESTB_001958200 [Pleodorina starrii]|uniref:non-specific serine/threonine protein kinase n=1 Tax=Pleodorina starrii TaxID=330485 RepID=A0A9W6FB01_9CHLO|nr:hypothetical protein PLESTB_001958200 [Pleodorina starrii]GLC77200.1 hypothetical protein PLESTF_001897500 [Pleodorina starrii]
MAAAQKDRQFKVLKFVGKGSYGSVFLVQRLADGQTYALKEMDVRSMSQAEREDSINEIRLLASVNHPNVTTYNEAFLDGNRLCIIMEYAADGDLAKVIKKQQQSKRPLPEELIWRYLIQVVLGLQALHSMKILHRDIKPGNIMVFEGGVVKIGDLGIAKLLTKTAAAKTQIGTPHYMGPEIWKNRPYSYTSDTWAVGCLLYELAALSVPFEARSMSELRYKVLRGSFPPLPSCFSRDLQQLVRECLDPNPDKRPSMDAILAHPAVASRLKLLPMESRNPPPTAGSALVETIKVPRGNIAAIKNKLPPAQYATDMLNMGAPGGGGGGHLGPGGGGGGGQMATIEEGSEEDLPPSRPGHGPGMRPPLPPISAAPRPPLGPLPPMPKPNYPPPPPAPLLVPKPCASAPSQQQSKLPQLPGIPLPAAPSSDPGVVGPYGRAGGPAVARPAAMPPPPPSSYGVPAPPPSQGGASAWSAYGGGAGAGGGAQGNKVSESHANYGAFYHQSVYTPNAAVPMQQQQQQQHHQQQQQQQLPAAAWQAGNKWPPAPFPGPAAAAQPLQPINQYQSPYISPYAQQRPYGGAGAGAGVPHLPQLNPVRAPVQASKPPPWNYGAQAVLAARKPARGQPAGARPMAAYYGGGDATPQQYQQQQYQQQQQQQGDVPRYPPPQWAPRPLRW